MLKTLGNILWHFPFFGFLNAIAVYLVGLLLTATVIASPIGLGLMEFGKFLFAPFGRAMVSKSDLATEQNKAWKAYSTVVMILYLPFGLILSVAAIVQVGLLFITIVGIPVALVIAKSLGTYWNPVNKKCVHLAVAEELERRKGEAAIHRHLSTTGAGGVMDTPQEVMVPQPKAEPSSLAPAVQSAASVLKGATSRMASKLAALRVTNDSAVESCASCGELVSSNAFFCGKCGAPVQHLKCPQCSEVNARTARFCRKCGGELRSTETPSTRSESRQDGGRGASATPTSATTATVELASKPQEFVRDENARAMPLRQPSTFMRSERVEQPAPSDVERVASPADTNVRPVSNEPRSAEAAHTLSGGGTSRHWLTLGALVVLGVVGGGYWFYKDKGASPQVSETTQALESQTLGTAAAPEPKGDVLEVPPPAAKTETPPPAQSQIADAPQVSVGDRWVTEVVDHQDPRLNYRAERTVTEVGNNRIVTSVRTLGKDYTRVVEYTDEWALVATHLRSGATTSYSPALPYLSFPLQPGRTWQARVVETDVEGKQRVHEVRAKMESWETVQVPAGTFSALKVVLQDAISMDGVVVQQGQDVSWFAPEARRTVKTEEMSFDPATGERRRRTISMVDYSLQSAQTSVGSVNGDLMAVSELLARADNCLAEGDAACVEDSTNEVLRLEPSNVRALEIKQTAANGSRTAARSGPQIVGGAMPMPASESAGASSSTSSSQTRAGTVASDRPQAAPAAAKGRKPVSSRLGALVTTSLAEGQNCLKMLNFECAIARAETVLQLDPENAGAVALRDDAKEARKKAFEESELK